MSSRAKLERAILDLRLILACCTHEELGGIPEVGVRYLASNVDVLEFLLKEVYAKSTREERTELAKQHRHLDYTPISDEFHGIARVALELARPSPENVIVRSLHPITPDDLKMLIRALQYAPFLAIGPHDQELQLSPIDQHGLRNHLTGGSQLSQAAVDAVPWETTDTLYAMDKAEEFARCKKYGLELQEPRDQPEALNYEKAVEQGANSFSKLLRRRAELDVAAVLITTGINPRDYHEYLRSRLVAEDLALLESLRAALIQLAEHISPFVFKDLNSSGELTADQKRSLAFKVEQSLDPYKKRCDALIKSASQIQPSAEIERRVRQYRIETGGKQVGDVFKNIQNSTIISRAVVQNWNQQSGGIDLAGLGNDLEKLRKALRDQASTPEHDMALGQVAAAETAAKEGKGAEVLHYLKTAGTWAWEVATKIGCTVAADAIKRAIGFP
jgi:hypothetical protein